MQDRSYKEQIKEMKKDLAERKQLVIKAMKLTVILLALSLFVMVVTLVVSLLGNDGSSQKRADKAPPVISFSGDSSDENVIYATLGDTISYRKYVSARDNSGDCTLTFDNRAVDITKAGVYNVVCTATDDAGNTSSLTLRVVIKKAEFSYESLMGKIEGLVSQLGIENNMSAEEKIKRVFNYVNSPTKSKYNANIYFNNESNSAREDWTVDWVEEAYLTLQSGEGDCYSYYAVSKAFFEYFGIENHGIKRAAGVQTQSGTHFWLMVNIGSAKEPRWYYYDATRLAKKFPTGSGCLFSEAQLENYNVNVNEGFYTYDHKGFPTVSDTDINTKYTWN